jgi:hypothetical protein
MTSENESARAEDLAKHNRSDAREPLVVVTPDWVPPTYQPCLDTDGRWDPTTRKYVST